MGLKNNKKGFGWRAMLKCMVRQFLYMHTMMYVVKGGCEIPSNTT